MNMTRRNRLNNYGSIFLSLSSFSMRIQGSCLTPYSVFDITSFAIKRIRLISLISFLLSPCSDKMPRTAFSQVITIRLENKERRMLFTYSHSFLRFAHKKKKWSIVSILLQTSHLSVGFIFIFDRIEAVGYIFISIFHCSVWSLTSWVEIKGNNHKPLENSLFIFLDQYHSPRGVAGGLRIL